MTNPRTGPLTWLAVALIVAIGLMIVVGTLTMTTYGGYYGMMGSAAWGWGFVMMAVPGVVLVLILLAALRGLREPPKAAAASPLDMLDERYARGEVTREDYLRARGDLGQGRAHS